MILIVAGSRTLKSNTHEIEIRKILDDIHQGGKISKIVSGMAQGPDKIGWQWAKNRSVSTLDMPAQWWVGGVYDNAAGYKRNEGMAKVATHCVVFWDGMSKGTKHMIDLAKRYKLKLKIVEM